MTISELNISITTNTIDGHFTDFFKKNKVRKPQWVIIKEENEVSRFLKV